MEAVRREFVVDVPLIGAWEHLARVEQWPSWARHIKEITLLPPGPLTADSEGVFRLAGGMRSTFRMEAYEPPRRWQWVARFATTKVHYDHRFEPEDDRRTRLIWVVEVGGPGAAVLGRLFGAVYGRNLDRAIPRLQAELRPAALPGSRPIVEREEPL